MREKIERNILLDSKYIIAFFTRRGTKITQAMLQKLLYFLEAIYMVLEDENYLFYEDFYARNFGPMNEDVYNEYKIFGKMSLELYEDVGIEINSVNQKFIDNLYEMFKEYDTYKLVTLSHASGSPWNVLYEKYGLDIPEDKIIDKSQTKEWFRDLVGNVCNEK